MSMPSTSICPASRPDETGDHAQRGGLARAIGTEKRVEHAGRHVKAEAVDGDLGVKAFEQAADGAGGG